jgi:hypothetical protein
MHNPNGVNMKEFSSPINLNEEIYRIEINKIQKTESEKYFIKVVNSQARQLIRTLCFFNGRQPLVDKK